MHIAPFLVVSYTWLNMVSAWLEWQSSRNPNVRYRHGIKNAVGCIFTIESMI